MNRGMHQKFTELQQVMEEEAWKFDRDTEAEEDDVVQKGNWESSHTHTGFQENAHAQQVVSSTYALKHWGEPDISEPLDF